MKVEFRDVLHVISTDKYDFSVYCVVHHKGRPHYYINTSETACLLDFIEDLVGERVFIEEKE